MSEFENVGAPGVEKHGYQNISGERSAGAQRFTDVGLDRPERCAAVIGATTENELEIDDRRHCLWIRVYLDRALIHNISAPATAAR